MVDFVSPSPLARDVCNQIEKLGYIHIQKLDSWKSYAMELYTYDGFKFHDNAFNLLHRSDTSFAYRV